ncbi:MAG: hypothetical protein K2I00_07280 [Ruminococcus sp.]|nr:hypothetical protein [Ruminococcus sp.]
MTPIEMLTLVSTINQLAEQSKNGIKPFSKAKEISFFESAELNEDDMPNPIYYDDHSPDENGKYPVVNQYLLVEHHDIISTFGKHDIFDICNLEIKSEISKTNSEDDIDTWISIKFIHDNEDWEILIHDGIWYAANL